jgi:cytochrome c-type biogenesis protein CcmH
MNARSRLFARVLLSLVYCLGTTLHAADAPYASSDPALEKRVMAVAEELRCLVCQNQTIADSHAELAIDLKNQVREMLVQGKSEKEIKAYMVERYGDFVLYRPQVKGSTWLLWLGPFVLLVGGLAFLFARLRKRNRDLTQSGDGLSAEAKVRAERLLGIAPLASPTPPERVVPVGNRKQ